MESPPSVPYKEIEKLCSLLNIPSSVYTPAQDLQAVYYKVIELKQLLKDWSGQR